MSTLEADTLNSQTTNGDLTIIANGTGDVIIDGLTMPTADGTANQVVETDGSGNLSFADAGGGATVLISNTAITGTPSTIDITGFDSSLYGGYLLKLNDVVFDADRQVWFKYSTDGGSTWAATDYQQQSLNSAGTTVTGATNSGNPGWLLDNAGIVDTSEGGLSSTIYVFETGTSTKTWIHAMTGFPFSAPPKSSIDMLVGHTNTAVVIDALQFRTNSGTFVAGGNISFYGLTKA